MNEFRTGGYCPFCLHATNKCTCPQTLSDLINKSMAEETKQPEELKLDFMDAVAYITEKRDDALENFIEKLKLNDYINDVVMHDLLAPVLRVNFQLKTLEDCMITMRFMNSEKKALNTIVENRNKIK